MPIPVRVAVSKTSACPPDTDLVACSEIQTPEWLKTLFPELQRARQMQICWESLTSAIEIHDPQQICAWL